MPKENFYDNIVKVVVFGNHACFTQGWSRADRVTYPVITPSAARGALESISREREYRAIIKEIHVLKPIKTTCVMTNEIKRTISLSRTKDFDGINVNSCRSQKRNEILTDVAYAIFAELVPTYKGEINIRKWVETFNKRVQNGQCFERPYLGQREYWCDFVPYNEEEHVPIPLTADLGHMLYDFAYGTNEEPKVFHAQMQCGKIIVPDMRGILS